MLRTTAKQSNTYRTTCHKYVAKQAKKDKMGEFDPEDLRWVVDGELEYGESQEQ